MISEIKKIIPLAFSCAALAGCFSANHSSDFGFSRTSDSQVYRTLESLLNESEQVQPDSCQVNPNSFSCNFYSSDQKDPKPFYLDFSDITNLYEEPPRTFVIRYNSGEDVYFKRISCKSRVSANGLAAAFNEVLKRKNLGQEPQKKKIIRLKPIDIKYIPMTTGQH